jgi:hypothetical protein
VPVKTRAAPKRGGTSLTPLADAFNAIGLTFPGAKGGEIPAAIELMRRAPPELIARCWQEIAAGEYGDPNGYDQRHLSFQHLVARNRFLNWINLRRGDFHPPEHRNGKPKNAIDETTDEIRREIRALRAQGDDRAHTDADATDEPPTFIDLPESTGLSPGFREITRQLPQQRVG